MSSAVVLLLGWASDGSTAPAPPPFDEGYAEVNGVRLHYASVGQGPLVLFLHGYPSFWCQWKDQMLELGRDHRVVGLDMRGYNLSSRPEGLEPYTNAAPRRGRAAVCGFLTEPGFPKDSVFRPPPK